MSEIIEYLSVSNTPPHEYHNLKVIELKILTQSIHNSLEMWKITEIINASLIFLSIIIILSAFEEGRIWFIFFIFSWGIYIQIKIRSSKENLFKKLELYNYELSQYQYKKS